MTPGYPAVTPEQLLELEKKKEMIMDVQTIFVILAFLLLPLFAFVRPERLANRRGR